MRVVELRAENFRLFSRLSLRPHPRLNFVFGANAAGKTSLLETLYTLGRGKSFRGSSPQELAGPQGRHWLLFGRVEHAGTLPTALGLRWTSGGTEVRVDAVPGTSLKLLQRLPIQILEPGMHRVLQDGPTYRRSFVDWGAFHVEQSFMAVWRRYRRALRQRNQALRSGASDRAVAAWEPELAASGEALNTLREAHLARIHEPAAALVERLLDEGEWRFELQPGWPRGTPLAEALARGRTTDRRAGLTQQGPHRAELRIRVGEHAIRNRISRGQQKLLIAALLMAQCAEIGDRTGRAPVLLVDDFTAELAEHYQRALLAALQAYAGQVFVTAFERSGVLSATVDSSMFHVERGVVQPL